MNKNLKNYDDVERIAKSLIDTPISTFYTLRSDSKTRKNKGYLGNLIQESIFGIKANNKPEPDFKEIGLDLELKVIPFKKTKNSDKDKVWSPKERLVLSMINYRDLANDSFENSHVYKKHQHVQFVVYFDNPSGTIIDAYQMHWEKLPQSIQVMIKDDYYKIQNKVKNGEAHLLSESDTNILAACRKGSGNNRDNQSQPFSNVPAKSRAFSIKPRYVKTLFQSLNKNDKENFLQEASEPKNVEEYLKIIFEFLNRQVGLSIYAYAEKFLPYSDPYKIKNAGNKVVYHLLKTIEPNTLKKLDLYGYKIRTLTINDKNRVQESVPLPHSINPDEMLNWETDFENSDVYHQLMDFKFIFVPIKKMNGNFILQKPFVFYFNDNDSKTINNLKGVWEETRNLYKNPKFNKFKLNSNGQKYHLVNFAKQSERRSFHVRPKAKNSNQLYTIGNNIKIIPQTFWINKELIQKAYDNFDEF